jgi:uncharacterized ion transporter superfamily protein YfcC
MSSQRRSMDPILLLGSMIVIAALLTWVLPAGKYDRVRDVKSGLTRVVPGSYQTVAAHPVGPWGVLMSIPKGLGAAADVVFFVLLAGAGITVVEGTGAIGNFLNMLVGRFGHRRMLVLGLTSILFLIGGATHNMYEEVLAFIPLLTQLTRRLGGDRLVALWISLGAVSVAGVFSPFNTFTLGLSQPVAEVPLFSGFGFRAVLLVGALLIWAGYLAWYLERGPVMKEEAPVQIAHGGWSARDAVVLVILNASMLGVVLGGVFLDWGLREFGAVFVLMGLAAGLAGGLGWRGTSERFAQGLSGIAVGAALVGVARAISVVLSDGMVLDTIANALFSPLQRLPAGASAVMLFVSQSILALPMPSDSGRAMISLPIAVPLGDLLGISRQMIVLAFQFGSIVSDLVAPTTGSMLAMLAMAGVSFGQWLRFVAVPMVLLMAFAGVAMFVGVKFGIV